ncbi:MAG: aspartyl protease family protein [Cyanobacteria bacterium SZAS TMP-1]|nr:aspartyl protease family protein [Cyanobacteria bacterium SZAS TMP-1]
MSRFALLSNGLAALLILAGTALPSRAEDYYAQAVSLYGAKRYAESEKLLTKHVALYPTSAEAHYYLASCLHYQRKNEEAKNEYAYIIKNFPGTTAATYASQGLATFNANVSGAAGAASSAPKTAGTTEGSSRDYIPEEEWIPFRRGNGGHFFVNAYINGHLQEMMLDTGAEMTVINLDRWKQMGLPTPKGNHSGYASGVAGSVGMWTQEAEVSLGKIKKYMEVHVADSPTVPPLLGETFFGDMEYNMDSRAGYIHFFKKGHKSSANAVPYNSIDIPFHRMGKNMAITAKINGVPLECLFDTGAFGVLLGVNQMDEVGLTIPAGCKVGRTGGVGGLIPTYFFPVNTFEVGDLKKTNFEIAVSAVPQSIPLVGQSFFGDRKYVIDNEKMLIRFAR